MFTNVLGCMTTLAIICGSFIALWFATIIVAAVIKGALTKSPFDKPQHPFERLLHDAQRSHKKQQAEIDKARNLASRTLERIHP